MNLVEKHAFSGEKWREGERRGWREQEWEPHHFNFEDVINTFHSLHCKNSGAWRSDSRSIPFPRNPPSGGRQELSESEAVTCCSMGEGAWLVCAASPATLFLFSPCVLWVFHLQKTNRAAGCWWAAPPELSLQMLNSSKGTALCLYFWFWTYKYICVWVNVYMSEGAKICSSHGRAWKSFGTMSWACLG